MANQIAKFKKYVALLDEVYQNESKTAVLESDATLAQAGANANEIVIPTLTSPRSIVHLLPFFSSAAESFMVHS